ncbi:hypothetical protein HHK36_033262 [Tetracentron sinense]|uniref:Mannose-1-phosphate guanyltransferase C-terminal domain-containing protein n=1 Tax=Tetracentron sinense TaxID=13715 RepID=A0A834Y6B6_TETSI|nr:hypothetical protein HHK36_033262 [Tetracentron sinense]
MVLPGFSMDIGHPRDYITGLRLYLDSLRNKSSSKVATGSHIVGNVLVDESAVIREGCRIGPDVVVGPGCVVDIFGWHSTVGQWAHVENMTILGEDVHVCDEIYSNEGENQGATASNGINPMIKRSNKEQIWAVVLKKKFLVNIG